MGSSIMRSVTVVIFGPRPGPAGFTMMLLPERATAPHPPTLFVLARFVNTNIVKTAIPAVRKPVMRTIDASIAARSRERSCSDRSDPRWASGFREDTEIYLSRYEILICLAYLDRIGQPPTGGIANRLLTVFRTASITNKHHHGLPTLSACTCIRFER
jgi:hypothetical protein